MNTESNDDEKKTTSANTFPSTVESVFDKEDSALDFRASTRISESRKYRFSTLENRRHTKTPEANHRVSNTQRKSNSEIAHVEIHYSPVE